MVTEKTRVLIVEDNPADLALLMHMLETASLGEHIKIIPSRLLAREYLEDENQTAENLLAVFIDMHFPSMGGVQLLNRIRKTTRLNHLRVIMMTSSQSASDLQICSDLGVFGYVQKPITPKAFASSIANIFHAPSASEADNYFPE